MILISGMYQRIYLIALMAFISISCSRESRDKTTKSNDPLSYLRDSVLWNNDTYDFGVCNEKEAYVNAFFEGENLGSDSVYIRCLGNFQTFPSKQWVLPKARFRIDAKRLIKGKCGETSTGCRVFLSKTFDEDICYIKDITIDGYIINDNRKKN